MFNSSILKKQTSNYEASKTESDVNASNTQENKQNQETTYKNIANFDNKMYITVKFQK